MQHLKKICLRLLIALVFVVFSSPGLHVQAMDHQAMNHEDMPSSPMTDCEEFCMLNICAVSKKIILTNQTTLSDDIAMQAYKVKELLVKDIFASQLGHYECRVIPILIGSYQDRTQLII